MINTELSKDQLAAARWARDILKTSPLILDTETTGLTGGQVCQLAVIDSEGNTLLDTLVHPTHPISLAASRIHGITDVMVKDAPAWPVIQGELRRLLQSRPLIIYNAVFDLQMFSNSEQAAGMIAREPDWWEMDYYCAMTKYAQFVGDWDDYHGNWRGQKLERAIRQEGIAEPTAQAHSALGDCLRTLALVRKMAEAAGEAAPT